MSILLMIFLVDIIYVDLLEKSWEIFSELTLDWQEAKQI